MRLQTPCYYARHRHATRAKYGLKGSGLTDCLGVCCFSPCYMCVDAIEFQGDKIPIVGKMTTSISPA